MAQARIRRARHHLSRVGRLGVPHVSVCEGAVVRVDHRPSVVQPETLHDSDHLSPNLLEWRGAEEVVVYENVHEVETRLHVRLPRPRPHLRVARG